MFNKASVKSAKEKEIQNWNDNHVYEEVEDKGQKVTSSRWVITEKIKNGNTVTTARLVARGFEENSEEIRKDSPTCSKEGVRILLSIAASENWECHTEDVKAAYLQGNQIEREVFLKPPSDIYQGKLWKLHKTVYGLCDAARAWYLRVKEELLRYGTKMCPYDNSLFMWYGAHQLEGIICVYVDDFLWAGTSLFEQQIIQEIRNKFLIGSSESRSFKYVGLNIVSEPSYITVDQIQYASSLAPIKICRDRRFQKSSDLSNLEKAEYRARIGQLIWIAGHTRPDIAFDTCELSVAFNKAKVEDLLKLNKLVERVIGDNFRLSFPRLKYLKDCTIECYTDASFANLPDGSSQGAFIILIRDCLGQMCPILWQSRKLRRVVKSTIAAETMALIEGAEAAIYIAQILSCVTSCNKLKVYCYVDNKSLVDTLNSIKKVEDKRLRIDLAVIENMIANEEICKVSWIPSQQQLADCLTKRGVSTECLRSTIGKF